MAVRSFPQSEVRDVASETERKFRENVRVGDDDIELLILSLGNVTESLKSKKNLTAFFVLGGGIFFALYFVGWGLIQISSFLFPLFLLPSRFREAFVFGFGLTLGVILTSVLNHLLRDFQRKVRQDGERLYNLISDALQDRSARHRIARNNALAENRELPSDLLVERAREALREWTLVAGTGSKL